MTSQIFVFFAGGGLQSVCEDAESALLEEAYLSSRYNLVEVGSIVAPTLDECWNELNFILGPIAKLEPPKPAVYSDLGLHCHECSECGTVWQHPDNCIDLDRDEFIEAHSCPVCGRDERQKMDLADVVRIDFPWTKGKEC